MAASRNLVLVHTEEWQDAGDFEAIKAHVEEMAPDIEVFIASNLIRSSYTRKKAAARPSLIFSPIRLLSFQPARGKVYAGQPMSKLAEVQRFAAAGVPVPPFEEILPWTLLDRETYGPYTVVKPSFAFASWGHGVELRRTEDVRYRPPGDYPPDHPGRQGPMIAQKFIDCGHAMTCRVLTLFGTPIFSYLRQSTVPLALETAGETFEPKDFMPSRPHLEVSISQDPEILAFAASAYRAIPEAALQACDILRAKDGRLYLLEVNPGGGNWMFSSASSAAYKAGLGIDDLARPFDAFRTCARVLVERTRAEAV